MLASCDNCSHVCRKQCSLGFRPSSGELLCPAYVMTEDFRDEVMGAVRDDFHKQVAIAITHYRSTREKTYAG